MNDRDHELFDGLKGPTAPEALKARALAAARSAAASPQRIEDRLWESRPLRLGWVAAAACLLALNAVLVTPGPVPGSGEVVVAHRVEDWNLATLLPERRPPRPTLAESRGLLQELLAEEPTESTS